MSRLEIVRRAPKKPPVTEGAEKTERPARKPFNKDGQNGDRKFPPRGQKTTGDRNFNKGDKPAQSGEGKDFSGKKPLQRRIIPQEIQHIKNLIKKKNRKEFLWKKLLLSTIKRKFKRLRK